MLKINKIFINLSVVIFIASCATITGASEMEQVTKIESALRELLLEQRKAIEIDAPFVYEEDIFRGGIIRQGSNSFAIGKWVVKISGSYATAIIEKRFSGSGRFESEVVEVELKLTDSSAVVNDWRAYQGRGTIQ